jgi:vanillate O-demethylase monooxygenase subunit
MYPKNTWYVACTPDEIDDKPLGRRSAARRSCSIAAAKARWRRWRTSARTAARRCRWASCERQAGVRLPRPGDGLRRQDVSACPASACAASPASAAIRWRALRLRLGLARRRELADPALIHHLEWADNPRLGLRRRPVPHQLRLPPDGRQPDGPDARDLCARHQHRPEGDRRGAGQHQGRGRPGDHQPLHGKHHGAAVLARGNLRGNGLADDVPVDRWQICHFTPPSHVMIEVGVAHAGKGGYDADAGGQGSPASWSTSSRPRPRLRMWYFWGMARNFKPRDQPDRADPRRPGQDLRRGPRDAGAQQRNILRHPERKLLMLNIDAGGVQSRRVIDQWLAREGAGRMRWR